MLDYFPTHCWKKIRHSPLDAVILAHMINNIVSDIDKSKFRIYLQNEFENRVRNNKSYSLRAFAKVLEVHASCLSVLLKGKRPLTNKMVLRFVKKLNLTPSELQQLTQNGQIQYEVLTIDKIEYLSDWKHDAVLELMRCEDFHPSYSWVAKCLELSETEIQIVVERLVRLGFIELNKKGQWTLLQSNTEIQTDDFTNSSLKRYQESAVKKSLETLSEIDVAKRYHGTMVMAIDEDKINEAKTI